MDNSKRTSKDKFGLVSESPAPDSYLPAPSEIESAARKKIEDPELLYRSLVRALKRRKGFGILFLQCTPAKGQEIFRQLEKDLPSKRIGRLTLTEPINNLFTLVRDREDIDDINVLFIEGIEKSLEPYIKSEAGRNDYYKLEVLPPVLNNVNQLRENFRERFSHVCFVFVVPSFAVKYFMYRAIDFFSWHSGIWRFTVGKERLTQKTVEALDGEHANYAILPEYERNKKIIELQNLIDEFNQSNDQRADLYIKQGWIYSATHNFEVALRCAEAAVKNAPANHKAWYLKGDTLDELGRYEEAIAAYDNALRIKPDYHEALNNKGTALGNLGRYKEELAAYDSALCVKPDKQEAFNNKGIALSNLGRYEEAIVAFDSALRIEPNNHTALNNKGFALDELGRYEEAITAFSNALHIKPDYISALNNKGFTLGNLERYEEAIAVYNKSLSINSNDANPWYNKACYHALSHQSDKAIHCLKKAVEFSSTDSFIKLAKTDTDFDSIRNNPQFQALLT